LTFQYPCSPLAKGGEGRGEGGFSAACTLSPLAKGGKRRGEGGFSAACTLSPLAKGGEGRGEGGFKHRLNSLPHALEVAQHLFVAEAYYP
jgi:hypothetical protein